MDSFTLKTSPEDAYVILQADLTDSGTRSETFNDGRSIKVVSGTTVSYYVSKEGYYPQSGSLIVDGNTSFKVSLIPNTHIKHRVRIKAVPNTAKIVLKSGSNPDNISSGVGLAYLDVYEGDYVIYKIVADGYMKVSGSVVAFNAIEKTIELEPSRGEAGGVRLIVNPHRSFAIRDFSVRAESTSISNIYITSLYNAVWLKQSENTDLVFTYKNVPELDEDGNPKKELRPIPGRPGHYEEVIIYHDTWVEEDKNNKQLNDPNDMTVVYGVHFTGSPTINDKIYIQAPARDWRTVVPHAKLFYNRKTQITAFKPTEGSNLTNVSFVEGGENYSFWQNQTEDGSFIFTRTEAVKLNKTTGEVIYTTKEIKDDTSQVLATEIVPVMTETWVEATLGRIFDEDLSSVYGLQLTGTPKIGDTFTIGHLVEKTVEGEVSEDGEMEIWTDYFVTPDVEYWAWLEGYDTPVPRDKSVLQKLDFNTNLPEAAYDDEDVFYNSEGIQVLHGKIKEVGKDLAENARYDININLHSIKNMILLDTQQNNAGIPGVYTLNKLFVPESYPSKYLHYELVGGGGGADVSYAQGRHHAHHGIHCHWEPWHVLYGAPGGSGAYIKGYLKLTEGDILKEDIVVNVGYGANSRRNGSDTFFQIGSLQLVAGGGKTGSSRKEGAGGEVNIYNENTYGTDTIYLQREDKGSSGRAQAGWWYIGQNLINSHRTPFGSGGGYDYWYNGWSRVSESFKPGTAGYAYITLNDSETSMSI